MEEERRGNLKKIEIGKWRSLGNILSDKKFLIIVY